MNWWPPSPSWPGARKIGPAYEESTELGPLVNAGHKDFVMNWIDKSIGEGAELVLDGRDVVVPDHEGGYYLGPTVFDHVTEDMSCGREEVFGPVLYVKRVANFEEGVKLINSSEFANGATIFTQSGHYAREFARRIDAGMVGINVGIPVPISVFPFAVTRTASSATCTSWAATACRFYTETKAVTSYWFDEEALKGEKVGTWEGTITRK